MRLLKTFFLLSCGLLLMACHESYRSAYHHTPECNWMNDPNGMFYDETTGTWHLYFQYNPYATVWGNMTWAHSTSKDIIHWTHQPNAILPDSLGDIFSGSAVVDKNNTAGFGKNAVVAIFTYSERKGQMQAIAYSTDGGYTFTKYEGNPVLTADIKDFRDPKVFWNETTNLWNMVLAAGQEVRFYSSPNLKEWTYLSSFGNGYGCHGGVWECPDLIQFENKDVLIVNINPGGINGGSATQYFVGNWDGRHFTIDPSQDKETYWMDYGKDHYATVSFHNAPDNRKVVLAWMSNWQYANNLPTEAFRSQNSIPRDITLVQKEGKYQLLVQPSPEIEAMAIPTYELSYDGSAPAILTLNTEEMVARVRLHIHAATSTQEDIILLQNSKSEQVRIIINRKTRTLTMDRQSSGLTKFHPDFAAATKAPLPEGDDFDIELYIDRCSIELFMNNGERVMTNLVFPTQPYTRLTIQ